MRKAQMFIVTMVFLVGLIFAVQQMLFQYSYLDMPALADYDESMVFENLKDVIGDTVAASHSCAEAQTRLDGLIHLISESGIAGYTIDIQRSECNPNHWDNEPPDHAPFNVSIRLTSEKAESFEMMGVYNTI